MKKHIIHIVIALFVCCTTAQAQQKLYIFKNGAVNQAIALSDIDSMKISVRYTAVDLGLTSKLKWATCNVGAAAPEEAGDYFAWGEIAPKELYTPATCTTHKVNLATTDVQGSTTYDAATANWGGTWRMPTHSDIDELIKECTWTWDATKKGYKVTSKKNSNSIFLPAAGYKSYNKVINAGSVGEYWTATPHEANRPQFSGHTWAHFLLFYNNTGHTPAGDANHYRMYYYRSEGRTIRPVCQ